MIPDGCVLADTFLFQKSSCFTCPFYDCIYSDNYKNDVGVYFNKLMFKKLECAREVKLKLLGLSTRTGQRYIKSLGGKNVIC